MAWTERRSTAEALASVEATAGAPHLGEAPSLAALYRAHFAFVWRSLRRLGVAPAGLDDATHDVFLVVHQKLSDFVPGAAERPWLFGIARRVAQQARRKHWRERLALDPHAPPASDGPDPQSAALRAETAQRLQRCLDALDEEKRCVLILSDLEQMSGPEIAQALDQNLNTVYARLRTARQLFASAFSRERARAGRHGDD